MENLSFRQEILHFIGDFNVRCRHAHSGIQHLAVQHETPKRDDQSDSRSTQVSHVFMIIVATTFSVIFMIYFKIRDFNFLTLLITWRDEWLCL